MYNQRLFMNNLWYNYNNHSCVHRSNILLLLVTPNILYVPTLYIHTPQLEQLFSASTYQLYIIVATISLFSSDLDLQWVLSPCTLSLLPLALLWWVISASSHQLSYGGYSQPPPTSSYGRCQQQATSQGNSHLLLGLFFFLRVYMQVFFIHGSLLHQPITM